MKCWGMLISMIILLVDIQLNEQKPTDQLVLMTYFKLVIELTDKFMYQVIVFVLKFGKPISDVAAIKIITKINLQIKILILKLNIN